ncbi:hypothetical protein J3F83DRAFT_177036 [Trichoderma novae-zelandiae]
MTLETRRTVPSRSQCQPAGRFVVAPISGPSNSSPSCRVDSCATLAGQPLESFGPSGGFTLPLAATSTTSCASMAGAMGIEIKCQWEASHRPAKRLSTGLRKEEAGGQSKSRRVCVLVDGAVPQLLPENGVPRPVVFFLFIKRPSIPAALSCPPPSLPPSSFRNIFSFPSAQSLVSLRPTLFLHSFPQALSLSLSLVIAASSLLLLLPSLLLSTSLR